MQNMRPGAEYDSLYAAALCRAKADWLVGMNATRLMSLVYHRTLNVGRVVSPTLSMLVERKREIEDFTPETFYTVAVNCGGVLLSSERIADKAEADALAEACTGEAHIIRVGHEKCSKSAPALYDLTTLQREANRELGFTAQQTLDYLQALYEKRLVTYPRTDSSYLTDGMAASGARAGALRGEAAGRGRAAMSVNAAQVCDSSRVTDHHAVVPTSSAARCQPCLTPRWRSGGAAACLPPTALRCVRAVYLRRNHGRGRVRRPHVQGPVARPSSTSAGAHTRARQTGHRCPSLPRVLP